MLWLNSVTNPDQSGGFARPTNERQPAHARAAPTIQRFCLEASSSLLTALGLIRPERTGVLTRKNLATSSLPCCLILLFAFFLLGRCYVRLIRCPDTTNITTTHTGLRFQLARLLRVSYGPAEEVPNGASCAVAPQCCCCVCE